MEIESRKLNYGNERIPLADGNVRGGILLEYSPGHAVTDSRIPAVQAIPLPVLNFAQLIHPPLVAASLILVVQPFVHDHPGHLHTDYPGAEGQDIGVVVSAGHPGAEGFAACADPHAFHFAGGDADADAGAAGSSPEVRIR